MDGTNTITLEKLKKFIDEFNPPENLSENYPKLVIGAGSIGNQMKIGVYRLEKGEALPNGEYPNNPIEEVIITRYHARGEWEKDKIVVVYKNPDEQYSLTLTLEQANTAKDIVNHVIEKWIERYPWINQAAIGIYKAKHQTGQKATAFKKIIKQEAYRSLESVLGIPYSGDRNDEKKQNLHHASD